MEPSDFLTLLGLAFAVWAIIPQKERSFLLLFFSRFELVNILLGIVFIHYLFCFDWLEANWCPFLSTFRVAGGLEPTAWAYIISLVIVAYPIIKVSFGYFSRTRVKELTNLYRTLIKQNEVDLLVQYIDKYHADDITRYLKAMSGLPEKSVQDMILRRRGEVDEAYDKIVSEKRIMFAARVYGMIVQDKSFVRSAANRYPELFAKVIKGMENKKSANESMVKLYVECLFETQNQLLVSELKLMDGTNSSVKKRNKYDELPILTGLFSSTKAAAANHVWYPVGEGASKSLRYDEAQKAFLSKKYDSDLMPELWSYKIQTATVYFNYMVRETVYRNSGWHMWMFYYQSFVKEIVRVLPVENEFDHDDEYPSMGHYVISQIFSNMDDWLRLARDRNTENRVIDTVRCMAKCVVVLAESNTEVISVRYKRRQLDLLMRTYFGFSHEMENCAAILARTWFTKLFLNPWNPDHPAPTTHPHYLSLLAQTWEHFDRVPYQDQEDNGSIQEFKRTVLDVLDIEGD